MYSLRSFSEYAIAVILAAPHVSWVSRAPLACFSSFKLRVKDCFYLFSSRMFTTVTLWSWATSMYWRFFANWTLQMLLWFGIDTLLINLFIRVSQNYQERGLDKEKDLHWLFHHSLQLQMYQCCTFGSRWLCRSWCPQIVWSTPSTECPIVWRSYRSHPRGTCSRIMHKATRLRWCPSRTLSDYRHFLRSEQKGSRGARDDRNSQLVSSHSRLALKR